MMTPAAAALRVLLSETSPGSIDYIDSSSLLLASYDNDLVALAVESVSSLNIASSNNVTSPSSKFATSDVCEGDSPLALHSSIGSIEPSSKSSTCIVLSSPCDPTLRDGYADPFSFADDDDLELYEDTDLQDYRDGIWEVISGIKDPEFNRTLFDLNVVRERAVELYRDRLGKACVVLTFKPTVPHCSQATTIALTLVHAVTLNYPELKTRVRISKGSHLEEDAIMKQANDKERVHAALQVPVIQELIQELLRGVS